MKKYLVYLHRWLGFPLGLLFVVVFGTGLISAFEEMLSRVDFAGPEYQYRETTIAQDADALAAITGGRDGIRQVVMPTEKTPYYQVDMRGETFTYAIDDLKQVQHEQLESGGFFRTALQLHRNFLLGREEFLGISGKSYVAWTGLIALLLSVLGLWLWWPMRKSFRAKDLVPQGRQRRNFYYAHLTGGVVTLVAVILLGVTGAAITYRPLAKQVLGVDQPHAAKTLQHKNEQRKNGQQKTVSQTPEVLEVGWHAWLTAARAEIPGAELTRIRFPRPSSSEPVIEFRFRATGDWLGLANSKVRINTEHSTLVEVSRFEEQSLGEKLYSIIVPLHSGRGLHIGYLLVLLVFSLLGTLMVFSGLVSFLVKRRKIAIPGFRALNARGIPPSRFQTADNQITD